MQQQGQQRAIHECKRISMNNGSNNFSMTDNNLTSNSGCNNNNRITARTRRVLEVHDASTTTYYATNT
jgi:hypothetical protein